MLHWQVKSSSTTGYRTICFDTRDFKYKELMLPCTGSCEESMNMKQLFEEQAPPDDASSNESSSGSRDDQEMGRDERRTSTGNLRLLCFPHGLDLNPARMALAEMVGTFILMFCICGIIASTQLTGGAVGLLEYAITGGLTIIVVIFSTQAISGSHINPAVTVAFAACGHFPWTKVPFYVLAQLLGSILATYVGSVVYNVKPDLMMTQPLQGRCAAAFWAELIASFMVMFLATSLTCDAQCVGRLSGIVIGISIELAILITGPVSGGSLNPARSLGPAIVSWKFDNVWIYLTAPSIGAAGGIILFRLLRLRGQPSTRTLCPKTSLLG